MSNQPQPTEPTASNNESAGAAENDNEQPTTESNNETTNEQSTTNESTNESAGAAENDNESTNKQSTTETAEPANESTAAAETYSFESPTSFHKISKHNHYENNINEQAINDEIEKTCSKLTASDNRYSPLHNMPMKRKEVKAQIIENSNRYPECTQCNYMKLDDEDVRRPSLDFPYNRHTCKVPTTHSITDEHDTCDNTICAQPFVAGLFIGLSLSCAFIIGALFK